jgi:hypothetical protein
VAEREFRVTVEDLKTGERQTTEVGVGDYILIPFAPCHVANVQAYPLKGTHVITVKGHRPVVSPRSITPEEGDHGAH